MSSTDSIAVSIIKQVKKPVTIQEGKIEDLEVDLNDLIKKDSILVDSLKNMGIWSDAVANSLPNPPQGNKRKPGALEFKQKEKYKKFLFSSIGKLEYRSLIMNTLIKDFQRDKLVAGNFVATNDSSFTPSDTSFFDADDLNILAHGNAAASKSTTSPTISKSTLSPTAKNTTVPSSNNLKSATNSHTINILEVVDLNDTTSINKAQVSEAKKLLAKYGNVAVYGADMQGNLDSNSTVEVLQVENVKSREKTGASTQYIIRVIDNTTAKEKQVIVSNENPIEKLTAAIKGESGCYCFSVKQ